MKHTLLTIGTVLSVLAPAATLAAEPMPQRNTVFYFDYLIRVTPRVLDKTIYPEIDRVHPEELVRRLYTGEALKAALDRIETNRERNRSAVQEHCKQNRRVLAPTEETKCGAGFRNRN